MEYFYDAEFLEGTQKSFFRQSKPTIDLISIGIVSEDGREYYAISKDFNLKEAWNRYDLKHEQVSGDMRNQFPNGITKKIYWIRENVLRPIFNELLTRFNNESKESLQTKNYIGCIINQKFSLKLLKFLVKYYGKTNKQIAQELKNFFLSEFEEDGIKMKFQKQDGDYNYYHCNSIISSFSITRHKDNDNLIPKIYGYYSAYDHVALCWLFGKMIDLPTGFPMYTIDLKQDLDNKERSLRNKDGDVEIVSEPVFDDGTRIAATFSSIKELPNYPKQVNNHNSLSNAKWNYELYKFLQKL